MDSALIELLCKLWKAVFLAFGKILSLESDLPPTNVPVVFSSPATFATKDWRATRPNETSKSSHRRCSCYKKGVLKNFAKLTWNNPCWSLFFNKVAGLHKMVKHRPETCNIIKKDPQAQAFSCEFCEVSKNTFFTEHILPTTFDPGRSLFFNKVARLSSR